MWRSERAISLIIATLLFSFVSGFKAEEPGEVTAVYGGGGREIGQKNNTSEVGDFFDITAEYRHVFGNGGMWLSGYLTYRGYSYSAPRPHSPPFEVRFTPLWTHTPWRYFGYSIGPYMMFNSSSDGNVVSWLRIEPSVELRVGVIDIVSLAVRCFHPDLAGNVAPFSADITLAPGLIPMTHLALGVDLDATVIHMPFYFYPRLTVAVQPTKLLSFTLSSRLWGIGNVGVWGGLGFHF